RNKRVFADLTIVRDMPVSHDPVVIAYPGDAGILRGAAVERAKLANGVVIANFQLRGFSAVFLVLRHFADGTELVNRVALAYPGVFTDHHMRADPRAGADFNTGT